MTRGPRSSLRHTYVALGCVLTLSCASQTQTRASAASAARAQAPGADATSPGECADKVALKRVYVADATANFLAGDQVRLGVELEHRCAPPTSSLTVPWRMTLSTSGKAPVVFEGSSDVPAGASQSAEVTWTAEDARYELRGELDPHGTLGESAEARSNNAATGATVEPGPLLGSLLSETTGSGQAHFKLLLSRPTRGQALTAKILSTLGTPEASDGCDAVAQPNQSAATCSVQLRPRWQPGHESFEARHRQQLTKGLVEHPGAILRTLHFASATVGASGSVAGTATLSGVAPASGDVLLKSSEPKLLRVPARISIPPGGQTATFTAQALGPGAPTLVHVEAVLKVNGAALGPHSSAAVQVLAH